MENGGNFARLSREIWCPGPDLNWHDSMTRPRILSPVRLPVSPPGQILKSCVKSDFAGRICQSLNSMKSASELTRRLIFRQWQPLLFILVLGCLISLQLEEALRGLGPTDDGSRWVMQLSMGLWDLLEGILVFLVLSWGVPKVHELSAAKFEKHPFQTPYLGSFLAEYMRMLAKVLMFGLLLLIPGFVAYCLFIFVPYIALFSKPYREDKVEALSYSKRLARPYLGRIMGVFILTTALQLACEFLPHMYASLYEWPARVAFMALSLLIGIWTYSFMFVTFERAVTEDTDGTHL